MIGSCALFAIRREGVRADILALLCTVGGSGYTSSIFFFFSYLQSMIETFKCCFDDIISYSLVRQYSTEAQYQIKH